MSSEKKKVFHGETNGTGGLFTSYSGEEKKKKTTGKRAIYAFPLKRAMQAASSAGGSKLCKSC